ncbi:MAG: molybdate ABC transporter substrate-binding protein [Acidobacteriota bacterium]|nr:molybdate ABC transporter substrate-binding protein [Acidobacteriota bacterium]
MAGIPPRLGRSTWHRFALSHALRMGLLGSSLGLLAWFTAIAAPPAAAQTPAREIRVLAAADLQTVVPALAAAFEHATGIKVVASFASSSTLAAQIENGSPGDLFLSADFSYAEKIVAANLADTPAPLPYARGTLVLFARKDSPFQPLTQDTLRDGRIRSLAIADPLHAPYGFAAERALSKLKLYDALKPRLVTAENVAQAAQFVESGNAQLGIISLTLATSEHLKQVGTFVRMPAVYPEIQQCAVVLKASPHRSDAHAFLDWLRSPAIQRNLPQYGLEPIPLSAHGR